MQEDQDGHQAQESLRSALEDWEFFARAIPHELKAPLSIISGFAEALSHSELQRISPRGQDHLRRLLEATRRASELTDGLLVLAPAPLQEMRVRLVDLSRMALDIVNAMREFDPERDVDVTVQPGMSVLGDASLLRLLLGNLLGNAWKFTAGKVANAVIEFSSDVIDDHRVFCVRDNGVGFDMGHVHLLFHPLARLHAASEFPGSGLGLALARRVVMRHEGEIWARSELGAGTELFFRLGLPSQVRSQQRAG